MQYTNYDSHNDRPHNVFSITFIIMPKPFYYVANAILFSVEKGSAWVK